MRIPSLSHAPQAPITGPERISASSILTTIALRGAYHLDLGPVQSRVLGSVVLVARMRTLIRRLDIGGYTLRAPWFWVCPKCGERVTWFVPPNDPEVLRDMAEGRCSACRFPEIEF